MDIKEFTNMAEITEFCREYYIPETIYLDDDVRRSVMQFQSRYITLKKHEGIVSDIATLMDLIPEAPFDFVIYRGGSNRKNPSRPYISSSFFRSVAAKYADNLLDVKKIIVRKGAKLIPLLAVNMPIDQKVFDDKAMEYIRCFGDPEGEIILDSTRIRWRGAYYEYG